MTVTETPDIPLSLLYVEDDSDTRELISEILSQRYPELRIIVAENGEMGLKSFMQYRPELVITDINMPDTDGISMAAEIKLINPNVEIIALTAYTNTEHMLKAIEIGISHYVLKPIVIEQIFKVIDRAIALIQSEKALARQNEMVRNLNAELVQKSAELAITNQELESFNYTVAHDLRSPMAAIIGYSQVLLNMHASSMDDTAKEYIQVISRETVRMNNIIGALLKFSVQSRKRIEKRWTDLSSMAKEIIHNLMMEEPGRQVDFCIAEGINGYCDPDLMWIVLGNLFGNAWKYSAKKDDVRIEFGVINKEEDIVYFVRDNGVGFDPQEADKLFVPFHRLSGDDDVKGFGIGLATASRIIQRHGGKIWAESEKGEWAAFYFTI